MYRFINTQPQPIITTCFYSLADLERDTFVWLSYPTNWRLDKVLWKRPLQEIRYKEDAKLPFERTGHIQQQVAQPLNGSKVDIFLWIFQKSQKWRQLVQGIWVVWINQGARKASPVQIQIESWKTFFSSLVHIHICSAFFSIFLFARLVNIYANTGAAQVSFPINVQTGHKRYTLINPGTFR